MSANKMREVLEAFVDHIEHGLIVNNHGGRDFDFTAQLEAQAREAIADDDAARGAMQDAGWAKQAVADCFATTGQAQGTLGGRCFLAGARWQASRAAAPQGEVVVTKNKAGQIVCITRQDDDGQILSVIAESAAPPTKTKEQP